MMWMWRGEAWAEVFVTLDCYGNLCTFADQDAPEPAVLGRPEECGSLDEKASNVGAKKGFEGHPFAFVVTGTAVGEKLKSPTAMKLVLEPTQPQVLAPLFPLCLRDISCLRHVMTMRLGVISRMSLGRRRACSRSRWSGKRSSSVTSATIRAPRRGSRPRPPGSRTPSAPPVSRHDIAGIWVAFFSRCQRYRCGQG